MMYKSYTNTYEVVNSIFESVCKQSLFGEWELA